MGQAHRRGLEVRRGAIAAVELAEEALDSSALKFTNQRSARASMLGQALSSNRARDDDGRDLFASGRCRKARSSSSNVVPVDST
jgi:hypothetical protein